MMMLLRRERTPLGVGSGFCLARSGPTIASPFRPWHVYSLTRFSGVSSPSSRSGPSLASIQPERAEADRLTKSKAATFWGVDREGGLTVGGSSST